MALGFQTHTLWGFQMAATVAYQPQALRVVGCSVLLELDKLHLGPIQNSDHDFSETNQQLSHYHLHPLFGEVQKNWPSWL